MSKKEKRFSDMKNNPASTRFKTLQSVMSDFGFSCSPGKGSHVVFRHEALGENFAFPVPVHGSNPQFKAIYVKKALEWINEVNS